MSIAYTVVLCTHNHLDRLKRTLSDLAELKPPQSPWEFLIIDNGCRDGTSEFLAQYAWPAGWQVRVAKDAERRDGFPHVDVAKVNAGPKKSSRLEGLLPKAQK